MENKIIITWLDPKYGTAGIKYIDKQDIVSKYDIVARNMGDLSLFMLANAKRFDADVDVEATINEAVRKNAVSEDKYEVRVYKESELNKDSEESIEYERR